MAAPAQFGGSWDLCGYAFSRRAHERREQHAQQPGHLTHQHQHDMDNCKARTNVPDVAEDVAAAGATRCPVNPRAAGATHAEHPAHPARTAAAVAAFLRGAIFDEFVE